MVNLKDLEEKSLNEGNGSSARTTPREHNWRRRNRRNVQHTEPKTLLELEELAKKTVELMEKHAPKSEHNYHIAMDLLRQQYNMNFMIRCEKCCGPHVCDEILAPER